MVGTITFHWATNYGAVLQAYALQAYLRSQGIETEVIDYLPQRVVLSQTLHRIKTVDVHAAIQERRLREFRRQWLKVSDERSGQHTAEKMRRQV